MKRLLALLCTAALLGVTTIASAYSVAPQAYYRWDRATFHTTAGTLPGKTGDSSGVHRVAAVGTKQIDTTLAMPLADFLVPPIRTSQATVDTANGFIVVALVPDKSGLTMTADSAMIDAQVSLDGANWTTMTSYIATVGGTGGTAPRSGGVVLELTSNTNCFAKSYKININDAAATDGLKTVISGATAPADNEWGGFRFVRFIWSGDYSGGYECFVGHWANQIGNAGTNIAPQ